MPRQNPLALHVPAMTKELVGERLRAFREALGLTPSEMADSLEIERTYWSRWEGGKRMLPHEVGGLICENYPASMDYLFLGRVQTLPTDLAPRVRAPLPK